MKRKIIIAILILVLSLSLVLVACHNNDDPTGNERPTKDKTVTQTKVVTYEGPNLLTTSTEAKVTVENQPLFVYDTYVNHTRKFEWVPSRDYNQVVIFDFEGKVHVEVQIPNANQLYNVVVRPLDMGVTPRVEGNVISFTLDYTGNYVVEYGVSESDIASNNAVHIFANPIETETIDPDNLPEKTVYVGPGVYTASALPVDTDDTTIYLAGGAVVYGQICTGDKDGLTICGRGIMTGDIYQRRADAEKTLPIELQNCTNVTIKDIAILDPAGWAITLKHCSNVTIDNIKIITSRANGDGISVQSCNDVTVTGGFVRTWDDSLVVKNVENKSTSNIVFDGVSVWTDLAQSMEVGYETYGDTMTNITFQNVTVLHNFHKAAMSIHNADQAQITNVTFQNITIEDAQMLGDNQFDGENDFLIDMTIAYNADWTKSGSERGSIKNVSFNNIKVLQMADTIRCRAFGEGVNSIIENVTISNVVIADKAMTSLDDLDFAPGAFTNNIKYVKNSITVIGAQTELPYKLELADNDQAQVNNVKQIKEQIGLEVPDFALQNIDPSYAGKRIELTNATISADYGAGTRSVDQADGGPIPQTAGKEVANLFDADRSTMWEFDAWKNEKANEFVAVSVEFGKATQVGNIRILGNSLST
ncbi:MAG: glycoside hydrolase family 28 protein, partial [Clostridia bacterium]|nr:glycoside hydrolase family 28 protein [Clostridia bacterium]